MTIDATEDEVVITGPGRLFLTAEADTPPLEDHLINSNAHISIQLVPIGAEREIPMEAELIRDASQEPDTVRWTIPNAYPHRSQ
jgi:hypothetical protein